MTKKLSVLILSIIALTIFGFALTRLAQPKASAQSQQQAAEIPDRLAYRHLFRFVNAMRKQAEEAEKQGKDATAFRNLFKNKANLSDYEAQKLNEIAAQCAIDLQSTDARAKVLIAAYKAQYPNGQVPHGQKPAPPPVELKQLDAERDGIVLAAREQLRMAFGDDEFNRFHNEFVKHKIAPNVQPSANSH